MGAYDDGGMTKSIQEAKTVEVNPIDTMRSAQSALDKALQNPKTSMSTLNKLTDKLAQAVGAVIDYKPTNNNLTPSLVNNNSSYNNKELTSTPSTPQQAATPVTPPPPPVKTAPIDTILFDDESVSVDVMTDLIFENIGGQELINIARNDTINGQKIIYQPIKNLTTIQQRYNPNNIVSLQDTSDKYFAGFSIQLDEKTPNVGNGPNGENIYLDPSTGDIVIEVVNMYEGEQVESQISITGTIYEADI